MQNNNKYSLIYNQRDIDSFIPIRKINEGSYGIVYKAKDKNNNEIVAIKKIKLNLNNDNGFPITSIREIKILFCLNHKNIITYKEIVCGSSYDKIYAVMEYMDYELKNLIITHHYMFSMRNIKSIIYQILKGVNFIHSNWVIHRDIKSSNILINKNGIVKIGDFGLSRKYSNPLGHYTPIVVTLWYRAPELLLYVNRYGPEIDIWSIGCLLGELILNKPIFQGENEIDQLDKIFQICGTVNNKIWPNWKNLVGKNSTKVKFKNYENKIDEIFGKSGISDNGIDFLKKMLELNPQRRINADDALKHIWFKEDNEDLNKLEMDEINKNSDLYSK